MQVRRPMYIPPAVTCRSAATSDAYTFNSTEAGEVVFYKFTPSASDPDLDTVVISAPNLPAGASRAAIKVGYYPRAIEEVSGVDCTSGCSIVVDRSNAD